MVMIEYYDKKTYLKLVKKQTEVYEKFIETINLILARLPENGKRFGAKWFDDINSELKEKEVAVRPYTSYSGNGLWLFYTKYDSVWDKTLEMTPKYENGESYPILFDKSIMRDKDACVKMLTSYKERLKNYLEQLNEIESKIDAFIAKWDEFDKMANDLRKFNLWNINVPYIGSCPISDK